eukprot:g3853.t1.1.5e174189 g3853  g3853.t1 contig13:301040-302381(-)
MDSSITNNIDGGDVQNQTNDNEPAPQVQESQNQGDMQQNQINVMQNSGDLLNLVNGMGGFMNMNMFGMMNPMMMGMNGVMPFQPNAMGMNPAMMMGMQQQQGDGNNEQNQGGYGGEENTSNSDGANKGDAQQGNDYAGNGGMGMDQNALLAQFLQNQQSFNPMMMMFQANQMMGGMGAFNPMGVGFNPMFGVPPQGVPPTSMSGPSMTGNYPPPVQYQPGSVHPAATFPSNHNRISYERATRGRRKKAKNKPKRPLSGYNLFFRDERNRILKSLPSRGGKSEEGDDSANTKEEESKEDTVKNEAADSNSNENDDNTPKDYDIVGKNGKKIPHGKIGFESLAKLIGRRWQELDPAEVERYKKLADVDMKRYKEEMEKFLLKEAQGGVNLDQGDVMNEPRSVPFLKRQAMEDLGLPTKRR